MRIISFSADGIINAAANGFYDWLAEQDADFICVQDLRCSEYDLQDDVYFPREYNAYFLDDIDGKANGVAIYCRKLPKAIMTGLGFADFDSLRAPYARRLVSGHATSSRRQPAARANGLSGQLGALNGAQIAHVGAVTAHNPAPALQAAAKALLRAQRVGFLGQRISHGVAFQLHYGYGLLAPNGVLLGDLGGTLADQLATLGNGTVLVAISQSPYTRSVVEAVARAHQQGAAVVALTDSPLSPIARGAAHTLLYGGGAPALLHSTCGALALAEALLVAVAHAGGTTVQTHWAQRQRQLAQDRAYHESPKDTP